MQVVRVEMEENDKAGTILSQTTSVGIDLLVVGQCSRSSFRRLVLFLARKGFENETFKRRERDFDVTRQSRLAKPSDVDRVLVNILS